MAIISMMLCVVQWYCYCCCEI